MKPSVVSAAVRFLLAFAGIQQIPALAQSDLPENHAIEGLCPGKGQIVRLLFWNTENLFDHRDDTTIMDEEFTSGGTMHWTFEKLRGKLARMAKTILAAGEWQPPGIIGLCEIENRYVLNKLVFESPLTSFRYRIIHRDSPDPRGIDVALLYLGEIFTPVRTRWLDIRFPFDTALKTRDILYVKGILFGEDTVHLFVNHWPSRRGGQQASAARRAYVASVLRSYVDSILGTDAGYGLPVSHNAVRGSRFAFPYIVIMGDFNDEPGDESLRNILRGHHPDSVNAPSELVNLMRSLPEGNGSHKFSGQWGMLDQFLVSASLLSPSGSLHIDPGSVSLFSPPFLLEDDPKYLGSKTRRTYQGPRYLGGFSDHLPIYLEIRKAGN